MRNQLLPTLLFTLAILCSYGQDYEKANQLFEQGRYAEAASEYEKVIPWLIEEGGENDTTSLPVYNYLLGASYYLAGENAKAEKTLQGVVDFCQKHCDYVNQHEIQAHTYLTYLYGDLGETAKMIDEYKKIVQLHEARKYKKPGLVNIAYAYNDLGIAYYTATMDADAINSYQKAIEYFDKSGSDNLHDYAIMHINLGYAQLYSGDYENAEENYLKGFQQVYKLFPTNYFGQTTTFRSEGIVLIQGQSYELAQKALEIDINVKKQVIGSLDTSLVEAYIYLGQAHYYKDEYAEAKEVFDQVKPILDKAYNDDEENSAFWHNYMGGMYDLIGDKESALTYYEHSIPYYQSIAYESPYGLVITASNITRIANELGLYDKAIEYGEIKFNYYNRQYSKSDASIYQAYMNGLYDLSLLYIKTLQTDKAEDILLGAYKKDPKIEETPDLHINLQDQLFQVYITSGQHQKAHDVIDKELTFIENNYGKEDLYYITKVNKGLLYFREGESLKGIELFDQVYPYFEGRNDLNEANVLNNMALNYSDIGNYRKAEKYFFKSLEIHQAIDTNTKDYVANLSSIARLYFDQTNFKKSEHFYKRAIDITEKVLGKSSAEYVTSVNSLGGVMMYTQRYKEAFDYYAESMDYAKLVFPKTNPMLLTISGNVGHAICMLQKFEDGIDILENTHKASSILLGASNINTLTQKTNLAMALHANKSKKEAKEQFLELQSFIDQNVDYNLKYLNESASLDYMQKTKLLYSSIHSYLYDARSDNEVVQNCFNSTLNNKGKLLESNTALKNQVAASNNKELIDTYKEWIEKVKALSKLQSGGAEIDLELVDLTREEVERLEMKLMELSSDFAKKLSKKYDWKEVQKKLKDDEVVIEFLRIEYQQNFILDSARYGAFILDKKSAPKFIPICKETDLLELLGEVAANNMSYVQKVYGKGEASKLYGLIVKPLEEYILGKKKVYISPDGLLHKVAFSAISNGEQFFGSAHQVMIINSGSVLLDETASNLEDLNPLLIGGVEYNNSGSTEEVWKYLEGTKTEISGIDELLKSKNIKTNLLSGSEATEIEFESHVDEANMIHIATHGFFYPEPTLAAQVVMEETEDVEDVAFRGGTRGAGYNYYVTNNDPMMRSGIALSGANQVWSNPDIPLDEDGVLTALDFSLMNLQNVELIVLSACETGLGDVKGSEGVYGLQRSLKLAGAKHIIMSLWQVPDNETKEFMLYFYDQLLSGNSIEDAFVATQRAMSEKYEPYYWGAFILL